MGKRKSRMSKMLATAKKAAPKLETAFSCPFCNHGGAVECRIDLKHMIAEQGRSQDLDKGGRATKTPPWPHGPWAS
uniref:Transcription elongation factor 1 homolog n=1 Tax=Oryza minuta TaxID=63629 RepID=A0A1V1H3I8_ORYMI|nr:hypothetical protein [Oryza minuta]